MTWIASNSKTPSNISGCLVSSRESPPLKMSNLPLTTTRLRTRASPLPRHLRRRLSPWRRASTVVIRWNMERWIRMVVIGSTAEMRLKLCGVLTSSTSGSYSSSISCDNYLMYKTIKGFSPFLFFFVFMFFCFHFFIGLFCCGVRFLQTKNSAYHCYQIYISTQKHDLDKSTEENNNMSLVGNVFKDMRKWFAVGKLGTKSSYKIVFLLLFLI